MVAITFFILLRKKKKRTNIFNFLKENKMEGFEKYENDL